MLQGSNHLKTWVRVWFRVERPEKSPKFQGEQDRGGGGVHKHLNILFHMISKIWPPKFLDVVRMLPPATHLIWHDISTSHLQLSCERRYVCTRVWGGGREVVVRKPETHTTPEQYTRATGERKNPLLEQNYLQNFQKKNGNIYLQIQQEAWLWQVRQTLIFNFKK